MFNAEKCTAFAHGRKLIGALALGAAAMSGSASAAIVTETINFNNLANNLVIGGTAVTVGNNNFSYGAPPYGSYQSTRDIGGGNIVMVDGNPFDASGAAQTLKRVGGGLFTVLSFDIADLSGNSAGGGGYGGLSGSGYRIGIEAAGDDGSFSPTSATFLTIDLSSYAFLQDINEFHVNIVSQRYSGSEGNYDDFAIDNIVVSYDNAETVPEPASLALLGLGLAGLGLFSRRRKFV